MTEEWRNQHTVWADLDRAERIVLLRRFAAADAVDRSQRSLCFTYTEVQSLFEDHACNGGPSHQYAYDLMEEAADESGFEYGEFHDKQIQLRVALDDVSDTILEYAFEQNPQMSLRDLGLNTSLDDCRAGKPSDQETAADD